MAPKTTEDRPTDDQLFSKKASFIQHSLPGLEAGVYEMSVQQDFKDSEGKPINTEELTTLKRRFGVQGPRYSLPASSVHSVFPPRGSAGAFSNSLAHVVLEAEKLPWIRTPYAHHEELPAERHYCVTYGGKPSVQITYDDDQATWMAVLLISAADLGGLEPEKQVQRGTAADLAPDTMEMRAAKGRTVPGKLPADYYSIFSYALDAAKPPEGGIDPGVGHTPDEECNFIDVPAALFNKIAPSLSDLEMMAHVRAVQMDSKPIQDDETVTIETRYSLVVGNRLPETMPPTQIPPAPQTAPALGKNVAFLVSLETMQDALRGHDANTYYAKNVANNPKGRVRLVVFDYWSFASWQDDSFDFERILKGLNGRDADAPNPPMPDGENPIVRVKNARMRLPDPPSITNPTDDQAIVQQMIELGYTPMNHLTRVPVIKGDETEKIQTVSWYRGPFAPFATPLTLDFINNPDGPPEDQSPVVFSADQLLRFDPNVGLYDMSYAAAWQLGRLIALQDQSFSIALYRWKKSVDQKFRMMLENEVLKQDHSDLIAKYQGLLAAAKRTDTDKEIYKSVVSFLAQPNKK